REEDTPRSLSRETPALAPQSYEEEDESDDHWDRHDDRSDVSDDDYEDATSGGARRSGLAVVLAMVGLVLIGAGAAFAYRAMSGGAAFLGRPRPPFIKPADGPNKIVPNRTDTQAGAPSQPGAANPGGPEKLVSREEQPVPVQPPPAPPKVLSTIPV